MSRGLFAQVLFNFDRESAAPAAAAFADAAEAWYSDAAGWAASIGVVTGTDSGFDGESSVTREQLAAMLFRYAGAKCLDTSARAELDEFVDSGSVSDYAGDAVRWAVGTGLIQGTEAGLEPGAGATRAQVAAIMERFCEKVAL